LKKQIQFIKLRFIALAGSFVLLLIFSFFTVKTGGLNWGIDFVGGVKLTAQFPTGSSISDIRKVLADNKIGASVQTIGPEEKNEYVISTKLLTTNKSAEDSFGLLWNTLEKSFPGMVKLSLETVGPSIGEYLKRTAYKLALMAVVMMALYLAFRFEVKYSMGAVAALFHDVILSIMFCGMLNIEINIPVVAALLTIFGYSVNDTIVVFDRIRETLQHKKDGVLSEIVNEAINLTLSRTILTSLTTIFAILSLYFLGGDVINDFAVVLLFGISIGTYSSIFVASPALIGWDKMFPKKIIAS